MLPSQPIRLIAMDMDGTLLTRINPATAVIPEENAALLRLCQAQGIHLALASGRMPDDASFYAQDAGIPMHIIGLNGSVILEEPFGKPLSETYLPESTARGVLSILRESGITVAVFGAWEVVAMQDCPLSWAQEALGTWFGRSGGRIQYHSGGSGIDRLMPCTGKIVALGRDHLESLAIARKRIEETFPEVEISSSWYDNFEINAAGVNKGTALEKLAAHLRIPMDAVMSFGDNGNDVPMLRAAGLGVAMGNATPAAREAADHVTLSNHEFGVAAALRRLIFGEG